MKRLYTAVTLILLVISACDSGIRVNLPEEDKNPPPPPAADENDGNNTAQDEGDGTETGGQKTPQTEKMLAAVGWNDGDFIASINLIKLDGSYGVTQLSKPTNIGDAIVRASGRYLLIINRWGSDSIQVFDAGDNFKYLDEYSVGALTNPQDMIITGGKGYVSRLSPEADAEDTSDVLIIDPMTGERLGGFNLKQYMTNDGEQLAFAAQMALAGRYLYVTCQDLSSWWEANTSGKVIVIDTGTDTVVKAITLAGRNPNDITYFSNKLYVADTGVYDWFTMQTDLGDPYGGIEVIDADALESEGIKIDDLDLNGAPAEIKIDKDGNGYVIASTKVVAFDAATYKITNGGLYESSFRWLPEIELLDGGIIAVTERDPANAGIVFVKPDGTIEKGQVGIGAAPYSMEIIEVEKK